MSNPLYVINDLHLGAARSAGTTPATAWQLRQDLLNGYRTLLNLIGDEGDVLVNGDFFDTHQIPYADMLDALTVTQSWLMCNNETKMYFAAGNHDLSKDSTKLSSFEFFSRILSGMFPGRFVLVKGTHHFDDKYILSHVPNQDLFNMELESIPDGVKWLFLHCNYHNHFAQEADHSLNLSEDQAKLLTKRGINIILGHEHQQRKIKFGKQYVWCVGNQLPSSVADCLNNDNKIMLEIGKTAEAIEVWRAEDDFAKVNIEDLSNFEGKQRFIRVEGTIQADEAAEAVTKINKFRQQTTALVVTNALKVESDGVELDFGQTAEDIKQFDVLGALLALLSEDEAKVINELVENNHV